MGLWKYVQQEQKRKISVQLPLGECVKVFNVILFKMRFRNENRYRQSYPIYCVNKIDTSTNFHCSTLYTYGVKYFLKLFWGMRDVKESPVPLRGKRSITGL